MESVRVNSELKKLNISIWQWIARVVPIVYLVVSLALHFIGTESLKDILAVIGLSIVSLFAIIWWWWAMDTMTSIVKMFDTNTKRYDDISKEIKAVKKELSDTRRS